MCVLEHLTDASPEGFEKALQEALAKYPQIQELGYVTVDGTLVHTQNQYQEGNYSGKHGTNGVKTLALATPGGTLFYFSRLVSGSQHDMGMLNDTKIVQILVRYGIGLVGDKGFCGLDPEFHLTPIKKPKGKRMTRYQKEYNYWVTRLRISVETVFARWKQYKILRTCRHNTKNTPPSASYGYAAHASECAKTLVQQGM